MYLKLAVLNNSGNVGKSTICRTLLKPRLENSEILKVETFNNDGTDDNKLSAKEFDEIISKIDDSDCTIIDVGSSNIENFMIQMTEFEGSHELIDYFIVPVTSQDKQQYDSINTIENILNLGIDKSKIRVIFSQAEKDTQIEKQFSVFLENKTCKSISSKNPSIVYHNNIFKILRKLGLDYEEVYNDNRDYSALIKAASNKEERQELSNLRTVKMLMKGFNSDLDIAFENLNII